MLSTLAGMNLNVRELSQHVEYEPDTYYAAFSAELEISASPLWSLINHCGAPASPQFLFTPLLLTLLLTLNRAHNICLWYCHVYLCL